MEPPALTPANQPRAHTCPSVDKNALLFSCRFFFFCSRFRLRVRCHYFLTSVFLYFCYPVCCSCFLLLFLLLLFFSLLRRWRASCTTSSRRRGKRRSTSSAWSRPTTPSLCECRPWATPDRATSWAASAPPTCSEEGCVSVLARSLAVGRPVPSVGGEGGKGGESGSEDVGGTRNLARIDPIPSSGRAGRDGGGGSVRGRYLGSHGKNMCWRARARAAAAPAMRVEVRW